jgi:hypothetical protein
MDLSLPRMPIIVEPTTTLVVHTCVAWVCNYSGVSLGFGDSVVTSPLPPAGTLEYSVGNLESKMDSTPHPLSSALVLVLVLSKDAITATKYALHLGIRIPRIISYIDVLKN